MEDTFNLKQWKSDITLNEDIGDRLAQLSMDDLFQSVRNMANTNYISEEEAAEIEKKVRKVPGGNKKCDNVVLSINRAAELAAKEAKEVFIAAIKQMTVSDAIAIVKGEDNAATNYLKKTTTEILVTKFSPIIEKALSTTGATKQWEAVMTTYNKIPMTKKINPDLVDYVSRKAIDGLFQMIEKEEANIRNNDVARSSALLKKVFG